MTHPSKRKGNGYEREIVHAANEIGLQAKRAYASNGESLGAHAEVDVLVAGRAVQAKRRAKIAQWLKPSEHVNAVAVREDRGESFVVLRMHDWLSLLKEVEDVRMAQSEQALPVPCL